MPKLDWLKVARWQGPNPVLREATVQGPGNRRTLVWETTAGNGVAVIEKIGDGRRGHFVDFTIHDKPFRMVVAQVKRSHTLERKRIAKEGQLC